MELDNYRKKRNYTIKKKQEKTITQISYEDVRWKAFLEKGDNLYVYMIHNYHNMFDGNNIKHFNLEELYQGGTLYGEDFFLEYKNDIHSNVCLWIKNEFEEKELLNKMLWKPFHCSDNPNNMYYGYRKLFRYKNYYFQLSIGETCFADECIYCKRRNSSMLDVIHFYLLLYGWVTDNSINLMPYHNLTLEENNLISEYYWNLK